MSLLNALEKFCLKHGFKQTYWVAFSGGLDSHVLLHALVVLRSQYPLRLCAIHVNHGLSPYATEWSQHCQRICDALQVKCVQHAVNAVSTAGESPEEVARQKRYAVLSAVLAADDLLLTAHHQDDQAETLLLQLFRGAGPKGLSAMPVQKALGAGHVARPLLDFTRAELLTYATERKLAWINDESNENINFTRNFVRHQIFPLLKTRWPAITATLSRVAMHCSEAQVLIDEIAQQDLDNVVGRAPSTLSVAKLLSLTMARRCHVLRLWLNQHGLPMPSAIKMRQLQHDMLGAGLDKTPHISWKGVELRRYRDDLYAMIPLKTLDKSKQVDWDPQYPLVLPDLGVLHATLVKGQGLLADVTLTVQFRQGGEKLKLVGRNGHHELKKLMQEAGIPPWERHRIPLIYVDGQLAAVAGLFVAQAFSAQPGQLGFLLQFNRI